MNTEELLKMCNETGNLRWKDEGKSEVRWVATAPTKQDVIKCTTDFLLPLLDVGSKHHIKEWIRKAVDIVGEDKFVYDSALHSEEWRQKRNLWYNDIIEQVIIQSAYHRKEQHKIDRLRKDFQKKRERLIAKIVAAKIHGDQKPKDTSYIKLDFSGFKFVGTKDFEERAKKLELEQSAQMAVQMGLITPEEAINLTNKNDNSSL